MAATRLPLSSINPTRPFSGGSRSSRTTHQGYQSFADQAAGAAKRLITTLERENQLYGRSEIEQLIFKKECLLAVYGKEASAVEAINRTVDRQIALAQQAAVAADKAVSAGGGFNPRYAFFGLKDIAEGRTKFAIAEAANELMRLSGTALGVGLVAGAVVGIGVAAYEVNKHLKELAEQPQKIAEAFHGLNESVVSNADQLRRENDELANTITKLQHRPENDLAIALDDARIAADKLGVSLNKDVEELSKYAGQIDIAIRAPEVRQMIQLYAEGTGQHMPLSVETVKEKAR